MSFVGINYQDTDERALGFLDELGRAPRTIYVVDDASRAALEYGVLGLPETFFVDQDGVIVGKVSGPLTSEVLDATLAKIDAAARKAIPPGDLKYIRSDAGIQETEAEWILETSVGQLVAEFKGE